MVYKTVLPAALSSFAAIVIPAAPLPSFPRKRESRTVLQKTGLLSIGHLGIPAYAGRTVPLWIALDQSLIILAIINDRR